MMGCIRLKDHVDFEGQGGLAYPDSMAGTFPDGTPGYMQFRVAVQDATKELTIEYVPAGGSFMGIPLGGVKGDVWVALSKGSAPITYDYSTGKAVSSAHVVLKGADSGSGYKLVLSGDCISKGDLVLQFVNRGVDGGTLSRVKVTQNTQVTRTTDNFTGCN